MTGKAYLIGSGPGRADLITVRGLNLLRQADVILYDHLIARELLDEVRPHAEVTFVGKEGGRSSISHDTINQLLISRVRQGKQVVRLKGGDPFVFGRGGEEALALAEADLPFEIVPGVSSVLAVPAYAGIPVTHRAISSAFAVITGHEATDKAYSTIDWMSLARIPTLIVLMAVKRMSIISTALISAGRSPDTPAAAVSWGTTDRQQVVRATLATLPDALTKTELPTPAIVVVGEVVAFAHNLAWFHPDGSASGFVAIEE